jgi:uncharacterized membrane protein
MKNRNRLAHPGRKQGSPERQTAPGPDWTVLALSAVGLGVSTYLAWLKWAGRGAVFCLAGSGCDLVQASRYALFLGIPTALWGAFLYAAIGTLAGMGFTTNRWLAAFLLAAGGVGFSVYLTVLSLVVIGGTCIYCLASGAIVVALLLVLVGRRPAATGKKSPVRPMRLAIYGPLAGVAAVVFGAFVFAAPASAPAGYQLALARHLKEVRAVMYGAYW